MIIQVFILSFLAVFCEEIALELFSIHSELQEDEELRHH